MYDKYILYVYTCLVLKKSELTDDELRCVFGGRCDVHVQLSRDWLLRFLSRCRSSYEKRLTTSTEPSPIAVIDELCTLRTERGSLITIDGAHRVVQIEYVADPVPPAATNDETRLGETLIVFSDVAFTTETADSRPRPCLVLSQKSGPGHTLGAYVEWHARYTVTQCDVRGLKVGPGRIYVGDGLALYGLVASWRTNACLTFDDTCSEELVRTLCALVLGDRSLGKDFRLNCLTSSETNIFDLRDIRPAEAPDFTELSEFWRESANTDKFVSESVSFDSRTVTVPLRDAVLLPVAFSILAENETVIALRHLLRDWVIVIPKKAAALSVHPTAKGSSPTPYCHLTEWFPSGYSLLTVNRGIPGVPDLMVYCDTGEGPRRTGAAGGTTTLVYADSPTLRVIRNESSGLFLSESGSYAFDQAVCLNPEAMTVLSPGVLRFTGCVCLMYAFKIFRELCQCAPGREPAQMSFDLSLTLREAETLLLSYLSLSEAFVASDRCLYRFSVRSPSALSDLRRLVAANPRVRRLAGLSPVARGEGVMREDLERELLLTRCERPSEATRKGDVPQTEKESHETFAPRGVTVTPTDRNDRSVRTGHSVLFGRGGRVDSRFKIVTVGIRTLSLLDLKILRVCGVCRSKHGRSRVALTIPNTTGLLLEPRNSAPTLLSDDGLDSARDASRGAPERDRGRCFFQLNYSPRGRPATETAASVHGDTLEVSKVELAIRSDKARGYEDRKLISVVEMCRRKAKESPFVVAADEPPVEEPECSAPLYRRAWLRRSVPEDMPAETDRVIGDGEFFPRVEIANEVAESEESDGDTLSRPLPEYKLNLTVNSSPSAYSVIRADRSPGERGSVYEACLDEAVLLGHCARVCGTRGAQKNMDVSACLSWFYRSVHPCVTDMQVDDLMLDYEFTLYGRGELSPVYALLSHLADSCRLAVCPLEELRVITLTRHRGASVWTRGTDALFRSQRSRVNTVGAFLCAQDHRLSPLLSRCCDPTPLRESELPPRGGKLLPRGDEEELLLRAYVATMGPVFVFERVPRSTIRVRTSLGEWSFLRLVRGPPDSKRHPGITVVDGYVIAHAAESPLFYLSGGAPLVQKLESVAVVVESSSMYRTDTSKKDDIRWPEPDIIEAQSRIKCKNKTDVLSQMFMRRGPRDPLDGHNVSRDSWVTAVGARWSFTKAHRGESDEWEAEYPVSESLTWIGTRTASNPTVKWSCDPPPASFRERVTLGRLECDGAAAGRRKNPDIWRGFDALCSRVLTSPDETTWSRGLCKVTNKGLSTFCYDTMTFMASLISIVEPGEWCAARLRDGESDATRTEPSRRDGIVFHTEVCGATEFIAALASRMLSAAVHEDVEIRCGRPGLCTYIQQALVWFAGAAGPFRSRDVTVYVPEADDRCPWETWTHTLPGDSLDVLASSETGYLVSCETPTGAERDYLVARLSKSEGTILVKSHGNVVLHSSPTTLSLSVAQGKAGVHATVQIPEAEVDVASDPETDEKVTRVHLSGDRSLSAFCELHGVPRGIRGPELWPKPLPWSKRSPEIFCRKLSGLKFRWESGIAPGSTCA